jgi:serine/threonine protein kinase
VYQLLTAMVYLHDNNLMHRDVKPANVLVNQSMQPVLCDFSLCTFTNDMACTSQHTGDVGTAVYMAPEVSMFLLTVLMCQCLIVLMLAYCVNA